MIGFRHAIYRRTTAFFLLCFLHRFTPSVSQLDQEGFRLFQLRRVLFKIGFIQAEIDVIIKLVKVFGNIILHIQRINQVQNDILRPQMRFMGIIITSISYCFDIFGYKTSRAGIKHQR